MSQDYELREIDISPAGITESAQVLQAAFPKSTQFTEEFLRWQYVANPVGRVVGFNAFAPGGEIAAHYATLPIRARIHGQEERGLLSLNTATHPKHQGKGLFTRLATRTFDHAASQGFGFVVGVANQNSAPGFLRKLAFQEVCRLDARLGLGSGWNRQEESATPGFQRVWDTELLNWRLANPVKRYHWAKQGRGRAVFGDSGIPGIEAVLGYFPSAELPDGSRMPIPGPSNRPLLAKVWLGLEPGARWGSSAYFRIPDRLRPSPLVLIFRDLKKQGRALKRDEVRFQAIDFDAY